MFDSSHSNSLSQTDPSIRRTPETHYTESGLPIPTSSNPEPEYQETWLKMWSNSLNPSSASCVTALDSLWYCYGPSNQLRNIYRNGTPTNCKGHKQELWTCIQMKLETDLGKRIELLNERRIKREESNGRAATEGHIWETRRKPPKNFSRHMGNQSVNEECLQHSQLSDSQNFNDNQNG